MRGGIGCVGMALVAIGCGNTDGTTTAPPAECLQDDIVLTCGTGETEFEALTPNMHVTMVHGPQGGWHIWTSISAQFAEQDVALLPTITIPSEGDLKISSTTAPGDFVALKYDVDTCTGTYVGQQARLDPSVVAANPDNWQSVVCGWAGETVHLRLDVSDLSDGRTASCEADVVVELDPGDVDVCASL